MSCLKSLSTAVAFALISSSGVAATTIGCGPKAGAATLFVEATASTSMDGAESTCPLLEDKELRKLVEKFGSGSTFAYPSIPYSCLSGEITGATLAGDNLGTVNFDPTLSYSESAQRFFPVPSDQGDVSIFALSRDATLQAGAAMTAVHLEGVDEDGEVFRLDLLLDDHFLVNDTGEDVEDFLVLGSAGPHKVHGRLTGQGQVLSVFPLIIDFEISGQVCVE